MARRPHRGFVRGPQRKTQWIGPAQQGFLTVTSGSSIIASSLAFLEPATIVRVRADFTFMPTSFASDLNIVGAIGVGVVTEEAFTAGIASVPDPFDDADWGGWLLHKLFGAHFEFGTAVGTEFPASISIDLDSKAMRKVNSGDTMIVVIESQVGAFSFSSPTRTLVKLV